MTEADIKLLFSYHPPNERTALIYEEIRMAEQGLCDAVTSGTAADVADAVAYFARCAPRPRHDAAATHYLGGMIALALARNAANEAIAARDGRLFAIARSKAQEARWLFCGSVAIYDAARRHDHPEHRTSDRPE